MNFRQSNRVINVVLKPKFTAILVLWFISGSIFYYWWYFSKILEIESQSETLLFKKTMIHPYHIEKDGSLCETIHIAIVCMNKCASSITPTLKSMLYHRQNPLHFHLVVDYQSRKTLNVLLKTWELPDVVHSTYIADPYLKSVQWIPNSHYSGLYALVKLLIPDILPLHVKKVIVLDTDLTFMSDVAELWHLLKDMKDDQFIGLVENESYWYLKKIGLKEIRWPALGRGYNTGVMLLDLEKMREHQWKALWTATATECLKTLKETSLGDQDVINAVIVDNPRIVYNISCQYNLQMSVNSLAKNCYENDVRNVKIIHWNSPFRQNVKIKSVKYFRNIHQIFVNLDGNVLKTKLRKCSGNDTESTQVDLSTNLCDRISAASRLNLRTHTFYFEHFLLDHDDFDVTLVLHLSFDRLTFLERLAKFWEGPISAAIYLSDCDVPSLNSVVNEESDVLHNRRNIGYHLVFKQELMHYPVNYLRNVALENVETPYVFLIDVDFVPMNNLYSHLKAAIRVINPYPQKKVLVVPAFETQRYRVEPPVSKAVLLAQLARPRGDVAPFRSREWPAGHRATDYVAWAKATKPYEVEWQPNYEPYLVVHRTVPKFDNRFSGFGWNKVAHSVELRAQGYRAVVLPGAFIVHTPHAPSQDILAFRARPDYRVCLYQLKAEFMRDLNAKYHTNFTDRNVEPEMAVAPKY